MNQDTHNVMRAAVIKQFGPPDEIRLQSMPIPAIEPDEILIRVAAAGVGSWDATEREGGYDGIFGMPSVFSYILGWDGAGTVAATGTDVNNFKEGDKVYATTMPLPKGGFYAEYTAVKAKQVAHIPSQLTMEQAAAIPWCALTALSGLDSLKLVSGETIMIFGASGGIGHLAIQFAKTMGAKVFAVASGIDGVQLALKLGADKAIDGMQNDIINEANKFAPNGIDTALVLIGGEPADKALSVIRTGGRIAYPDGVWPAPRTTSNIESIRYNGDTGRKSTDRLNAFIKSESFTVHIDKVFPLEQAIDAHKALKTHFIGKIVLKISTD